MISQFDKAKPVRKFFLDEDNCLKYLKYRRWKGGDPWCIKCGHSNVYEYEDKITYKCAKCRKKFSITKGTIFEGTRIPLSDWFSMILDVCVSDTTSADAYKEYEVSMKSCWYARQRIMQLFTHDFETRVPEVGTWEFDEIYIGVMESKMSKEKVRKKEKIAGFGHRTPILAFYNRNNKELLGVVLPVHAGKDVTQEYIKKVIHRDSTIYSDKSKDYSGLLNYFKGGKQFIHKVKDYGGGEDHSNTVEGAFAHFRAMVRNHTQLPAKYLQRYWDVFCFRYNCHLKGLNVIQMFELAFENIERPITKTELQVSAKAVDEIMLQAKEVKDLHLRQQKVVAIVRHMKRLLREAIKRREIEAPNRKSVRKNKSYSHL